MASIWIGWRQKKIAGRILIYAWSPFLLMIVAMAYEILTGSGKELSMVWLPASFLFEGICLSMALADRTRRLQNDMTSQKTRMKRRLEDAIQSLRGVDLSSDSQKIVDSTLDAIGRDLPEVGSQNISFQKEPSNSETAFQREVFKNRSHGWLVVNSPNNYQLTSDEILFLENMTLNLASSLETLSYVESEKSLAKTHSELASAQKIQRACLSEAEDLPQLEVSSYYRPADEVGGDWFSTYYLQDSKLAVILCGDVTGHGLASALIVSITKGAVDAVISQVERESVVGGPDIIGRIFTAVNKAIYSVASSERRHMTMICFVIAPSTGEVWQSTAAHPAPFVIRADKVNSIAQPTTILGAFPNAQWPVKNYHLNYGEHVLCFTDGLTENTNSEGQVFPQRRLKSRLASWRKLSSEGISKALREEFHSFWKDHDAEDDVTYLVISRRKPLETVPPPKSWATS